MIKVLKIFVLVFGVLLSPTLSAQENAIVEKEFVILNSSKDYTSAMTLAKEASNKLNLELNLRNYYENKEGGLITDTVCGCGELHEYIARGRWDDGAYVSIEYSDQYKGFKKGYYIVVAASGYTKSEDLSSTLVLAKKFYADAYIKKTTVYIGCMH